MEIQELGISTTNIKEVQIPVVDASLPVPRTNVFTGPPVVVNIGFPIVDIPGCVEAHETNNAKNNQIKTDDQRGTYVICDGGIPSYNPINRR